MPEGRASLAIASIFAIWEVLLREGLKISGASWLVSVWGNDSFRVVTCQPSAVVAARSWDTDHGKPLPIFRGAPSTDLQQQVAPPSFQHASSPTTLTRKSRSAAGMKGFNLATGKRKQQTANAESLSEKTLRWMGGTGHEFL